MNAYAEEPWISIKAGPEGCREFYIYTNTRPLKNHPQETDWRERVSKDIRDRGWTKCSDFTRSHAKPTGKGAEGIIEFDSQK